MRANSCGFTLIELMIVLAIIGALMASALPDYRNYLAKAKYTEVVMATAPIKMAIAVCAQTGDCINDFDRFGSTSGSGTPDIVIQGQSGDFTIPAPRFRGKILSTMTQISPRDSNVLIVTLIPSTGASGGITPSDTLFLRAALQPDKSVSFSLGGGCKIHSGGSLC